MDIASWGAVRCFKEHPRLPVVEEQWEASNASSFSPQGGISIFALKNLDRSNRELGVNSVSVLCCSYSLIDMGFD